MGSRNTLGNTDEVFQSSLVRWPVHVEVRLQTRTSARFETVRTHIHNYISSFDRIAIPSTLQGWQTVTELSSAVEQITICESRCPSTSLTIPETNLQIHVYQPLDGGAFDEFSNSNGEKGEGDDTMAASICELPSRGWEGLWDSLIYSNDVKMKLLDYIHATLIMSDANVDFNLVSWNRVVLLHGPPGTGKTSLCRALAQKLSVRLSHRYSHARLLEINSHSLFSKWFSESGKLVQRLFTSITELVDEDDAFVVVLIDEVESLTAARAGAIAGTEPSDGLRVVNALLTQLDKLKHRKNVLIMATSNLVKAIDSAFVDRADIIQYIDLPSREAIYDILRSSVCEIMAKGVIVQQPLPTLKQVQLYEVTAKPNQSLEYSSDSSQRSKNVGLKLLHLAAKCQAHGMSGRSLRRLPVLALAHSLGLGQNVTPFKAPSTRPPAVLLPFELGSTEIETWITGMDKIIDDHGDEIQRLV